MKRFLAGCSLLACTIGIIHAGPALAASPFKLCPNGVRVLNSRPCPVSVPPTPTYKLCAGGTRVLSDRSCPAPPPVVVAAPPPPVVSPAPAPPPNSVPAFVPTSAVVPVAPIASNFDLSSTLVPAWGTGQIAGQDGDTVGAFRFACLFSQILRDDPVMFPGQPGKSHLHVFFGNTSATGNSTYATLRALGGSTCGDDGAGHGPNRSAYWAPAMLDGHGNVIMPDLATIYYKRYPSSSQQCSPTSPTQEGICVPLPTGGRYIFGYDMVSGVADPNNTWWNCQGQTAIPFNKTDVFQDHYPSLAFAATKCPTGINPDGSHNQILQIIRAPPCWDGVHLDSANHRSHMAYEVYTGQGYSKCPADHPYLIPQFQLSIQYTVDANLNDWRLSSDEMHPELPAGSTSHSDWFGAWDPTIMDTWMANCIDKRLNCSGGDLGNGKQIKNAWARPYTGQRLIPLSTIP